MLCDLVEEGHASDILHDQVDILLIVVGFVVLDNVGVVERVKDGDLLHDTLNIVSQLHFVENFNCNLEILVVLVLCQEDTAEGANSQHLRLRIDEVVLLELMYTLLFVAKTGFDDLFFHALRILSICFGATFLGRIHASHFDLFAVSIIIR